MSKIRCTVCMHQCNLAPGQTGICGARMHVEGTIVSTNYGHITGFALDPVRKKPLAYFQPDKNILSVGSFGCNLSCPFCQNYSIATGGTQVSQRTLSPSALADLALELVPKDNIGVAFTYNEPLIGYEFVRDTARLVKERGLSNVVVTSGSVSTQVLRQVLPYIDAFNIDLKSIRQDFYHWVGGELTTVLDFIKTAYGKAHIELTTLIIPGKNDTPEEMQELVAWIAALDPEIPLHISRFFPSHRCLHLPPTPLETLYQMEEIAREKLSHVVLGNV